MDNLTVGYVRPGQTLEFSELVAEYCDQLDHKILLMLLAILSLYVVRVFLLYRGVKGLTLLFPVAARYVRWWADCLESFLDTASLFSSLFLLYLFYEQGMFSFGVRLWLFVLLVFVVLAGMSRVLEWRNRR